MPTNTSRHIQPYLARVVAPDGDVVGTTFQVQPGVLVTAWHVLRELGGARSRRSGEGVQVRF